MDTNELKVGYTFDYISGQQVRATPEEVDAVQVFSQRLVENYRYPKTHIQTHPQYRVRRSPSDKTKSYPVDIAVFSSESRAEEDLFMIVECKKRNRKDGLAQLKLYLSMSPAEIGVWFNGVDHVYIRKVTSPDGRQTYDQLATIPRYGQRIEEIGHHERWQLDKPSNLKSIFRDIRNHLAGNVTGITRDEALAQEIINLLFCKIYDEINTGMNEVVTFRSSANEDPDAVKKRVVGLFDDKVKHEYADVFTERDAISLDADSVVYIVGELQDFCITEADRDAIGDAFEIFIGPALRGPEGQFFTPRNVVKLLIDIIDPEPGQLIIDPACGSGGFLIAAVEHVWQKLEAQAIQKGWNAVQLDRKKRDTAARYFRGIDKDSFLAKVTKAYMAIIGDGRGGIFCENALLPPRAWPPLVNEKIKLGTFDVVLTNPPFGTKIPIKGREVLSQYSLGYKWKKDKTGSVSSTSALHEEQPPQILFLERCLQLLKDGGKLGIVLPESMLGNPSYSHVLKWALEQATLLAVVALPEALFKTSGKGGTHTKVCAVVLQKGKPTDSDNPIFMADAKWCGHDSRGNPTERKTEDGQVILLDDVPIIASRYQEIVRLGMQAAHDRLGFILSSSKLINSILIPKYYDPELAEYIRGLEQDYQLITIGDLIKDGALAIATGVEIGKMNYGTGPVPFIRTSDISNWELKLDPKQGVSEGLYNILREKLDVRAGDILMVRDGTYLVGTSAIVTASDERILYQSHIYKLRNFKPEILDNWLLFACLNTPVVKRQIRSKQFTQDIIDTLGSRILELVIPVPRDPVKQAEIAATTREIVEGRVALRNKAKLLLLDIEGIAQTEAAELEIIETL